MFSFNLYDARMVERHLLDNMTEEESVFLQGSAVLLLALVKKKKFKWGTRKNSSL